MTPDAAYRSLPARLWLLFNTFFWISTLTLGGGLAMLPVIEEKFVRRHKLITEDELLEMTAVTQMIPGIIAANSASYIGTRVAGFAGAVFALLGAILPSFVAILLVAMFLGTLETDNRILAGALVGVRAAVCGLILNTAWKLLKIKRTAAGTAIAAAAFVALFLHVKAAFLILLSIPVGLALHFASKIRGAGK